MRVDKDKGYIDLSKRRVSPEDVIKCEDRYNKSKTVHTIMRHVADRTNRDMDDVNSIVAWPLFKKYGHAYDAFKLSITCVRLFLLRPLPPSLLSLSLSLVPLSFPFRSPSLPSLPMRPSSPSPSPSSAALPHPH